MKENWGNSPLFYFLLMGGITICLILQTTHLPGFLQRNEITTFLFLPLVIHFLIHAPFIFSVALVCGLSWIVSVFLPHSPASLFLTYTTLYSGLFLTKNFYHGNPLNVLLSACVLWTFFFPFLLKLFSQFSFYNYSYTPSFFSLLISSVLSLGIGFLSYPLLKKFKPLPSF